MENKLRRMFDYQRFENEPRLKAMLDGALGSYDFPEEGELPDDAVDGLCAAGSVVKDPKRDKEKRS